PDAQSLQPGSAGGVGELDPREWRGAARGGASGNGRTLSADSGRAALPRLEAGGEDNHRRDRAAGFRPAGSGDDGRRKPAAAGPELYRAGGGVLQAEPRFRIDSGADRTAG